MALIRINSRIAIDDAALEWQFIRASGPGGQNVNKVATAVQLRYDARHLSADVLQRLSTLAGRRLTADHVLIIDARQYRTQERNREDALNRLLELLRQAAVKPKPRVKTKPTKASRERRLDAKRRDASTKRIRQRARFED